MPRGDRTGPLGQGPGTGRRLGDCTQDSYVDSNFMGFGRGRGTGRGMGMGRGRGLGMGLRNAPVQTSAVQTTEKADLEKTVDDLKRQIALLAEKIDSMGKN